jgi:hypothetical protein
MPNVNINISDYTGEYASINGTKSNTITVMDIARGMVSIGRTHWAQKFRRPALLLNDLVHEWTGLRKLMNNYPKLTNNSRFAALDPTDKGRKSYIIGMGITKILSEKILKVKYLQNVDGLIQTGIVKTSGGTKQRGDLVGLDKNKKWHVLEAKGRSSIASEKDKDEAKAQAEKIAKIDDNTPATKSYCISCICELDNEIFLAIPKISQKIVSTLRSMQRNMSGFIMIRFLVAYMPSPSRCHLHL